MTLSSELFNAILSMDAYNRGYDSSITLSEVVGTQIGGATITVTRGQNDAQDIGFYALAYDYNGETIVSYRGTDYPEGEDRTIRVAGQDIPFDIYHGWPLGGGNLNSEQGLMALEFYKAIDGSTSSTISLTGHSLGGGLAAFVAAVYDLNADIYDSMAFEEAAERVFYVSTHYDVTYITNEGGEDVYHDEIVSRQTLEAYQNDPDKFIVSSPLLDENIKNTVFGTLTVSEIELLSEDYVGITAYGVDGEILSAANAFTSIVGQHVAAQPDSTITVLNGIDLIPDGSLNAYWLKHVSPLGYSIANGVNDTIAEAIARHSQATLVMTMFADGVDAYSGAGTIKHDNDFAASIGFRDVDPDSDIGGQAQQQEKYAEILRTALAYSAIDEGTRPFGDTGIRALYDDANDLGRVVTAAGNGSLLTEIARDISEVFAQFAGQLALNKVTVLGDDDTSNDMALSGVLTYRDDQSLALNFSEPYWTQTISANNHFIDTVRAAFLVETFSEAGIDKDIILDAAEMAWGERSYLTFDKVILSSPHTSRVDIGANHDADAKATLYIADPNTVSQKITGSNADDFLIGSGEDDTLYGEEGRDILIGGDGIDKLHGGDGDDFLEGGDGDDFLYGGGGDNILIGGDGDDVLDGGSIVGRIGKNILQGGSGSDIFRDGIVDYSADISSVYVNVRERYAVDGWGDTDEVYETVDGYILSVYDDHLDYNETLYENTSLKHGVNGNDGFDTLVLSDGVYYFDQSGVLTEKETGTDFINFENIYFSANSNSVRLLVDQVSNDYIPLLNNVQNNTIHLDYVLAEGALTFNYTSNSLSVSGVNISHNYNTDYLDAIEGNSARNVYNIYSLDEDIDIYTGSGNDIINHTDQGNDDMLTIYYRGGDDVYSITDGIEKIVLPYTVSLSDLTFSTLNNKVGNSFDLSVDILGAGSIDLDFVSSLETGTSDFFLIAHDGEIRFSKYYSNIQNEIFWKYKTVSKVQGYVPVSTWSDDIFEGISGRVNSLHGLGGDDTISGRELDDNIYGEEGNDTLYGRDGDDDIYGGDGNDTLYGENGDDRLYGGAGDDRLYSYETQGISELLDGGEGSDTAIFSGQFSDYSIDTYYDLGYLVYNKTLESRVAYAKDVEFIEFSDITLDLAEQVINGTAEDDILDFSSKVPPLEIRGGEGNDVIYGGSGNNTLIGGAGDDTIDVGLSASNVVYGGGGDDIIKGVGINDTVYAGTGNDIITIDGGGHYT